ncbi:MAG: lipolytic protein family [Frankiales bacterium]|nr:lipolytic protein family [Frankiales bacterium]
MTLRLALLGDSIAFGTGASRPQDRLGPRLAAALADRGLPAESRAFAVPGSTSAGLAQQVRAALAWRPDVAVVVVGANDLTRLRPVEQAAAELRAAVSALRATGTAVVLAPAPDLSVVPHVPAAARELVRLGSLRLRTAQVAVALAEGARVADVDAATSSAFAADPSLFAADRFHPSSRGYALVAEALLPPVLAAVDDREAQAG